MYRRPLVAFVEGPEHQSIFRVEGNAKMLQNFVKEIFCTFRRQIGEDQDVRFVICVIALDRLSIQKQPLVVVHKLDDIEDAPTSNPLGSEPKCLAFTGPRQVWTHGASAAKILVRSPEESRNPV